MSTARSFWCAVWSTAVAHIAAMLVGVAGGFLGLMAHEWELEERVQQVRAAHLQLVRQRYDSLVRELERGMEELEDVRNFFQHLPVVEQDMFLWFSEAVFPENGTLHTLHWIPGEKTERFVSRYVYPLEEIRRVRGEPMDQERLIALRRAGHSGRPAATGPMGLPEEHGESALSVSLFFPIYHHDPPLPTATQRWDDVRGFVMGVVHLGKVVDNSLSRIKIPGLRFQLFDVTYPVEQPLIPPWGGPDVALVEDESAILFQKEMRFVDRKWLLVAQVEPWKMAMRDEDDTRVPVSALIGLVTLLLVLYLVRQKQAILHLNQVQSALRDSRELFRQLAENIHDVFWVRDPVSNSLLYVSPACEEIWGLQAESLVRNEVSWLDTVVAEDRQRLLAVVQAQNQELPLLEYRIQRPDGTVRWIQDRAYAVPGHAGHPSRIVGVARDITEHKRMEAEKNRLQAQAIHSARLATLGELSASVAHEINNPNNAIGFNAQILAEIWRDAATLLRHVKETLGDFPLGGLPLEVALSKTPRLIDDIHQGSCRISDIILNLKEMARRDGEVAERPVAIPEVMAAAVRMLQDTIRKKTDHFQLTVVEELPVIPGNPQQLEQVFINVIQNALQALERRDQAVWVTVGRQQENGAIQVVVEDQGVGIPAANLPLLTEPFFTTKLDTGGTGLGLSISATILQNHGGGMVFDSREKQGTRVTIVLPVRECKGNGH